MCANRTQGLNKCYETTQSISKYTTSNVTAVMLWSFTLAPPRHDMSKWRLSNRGEVRIDFFSFRNGVQSCALQNKNILCRSSV